MKVTEKQRNALDELVAAMTQAGVPVTRSTLCRVPLLPYLVEPETVLARKRGWLAVLGPLTLAEATQLLNQHFYAACDRLVQTGEAQVTVIWASQGCYVRVWLSNDYLLECRLRELDRAAVAAKQAPYRDKPDPVVTAALRAREKEALKKRASALGLDRSPIGHSRAGALLVGDFAEEFPAYFRERKQQISKV